MSKKSNWLRARTKEKSTQALEELVKQLSKKFNNKEKETK